MTRSAQKYKYKCIFQGVQQGLTFEPVLYQIYFNEIVTADDTTFAANSALAN